MKWIKNRWKEKGTKAVIGTVLVAIAGFFGLELTVEQQLAAITVLGIFLGGVGVATKTAKAEDRDD